MDISLFKKSLASKQKILKEGTSDVRNAESYLKTLNKCIFTAQIGLEEAQEALDEYVFYSKQANILDDKKKKDFDAIATELKELSKRLDKLDNKVPQRSI